MAKKRKWHLKAGSTVVQLVLLFRYLMDFFVFFFLSENGQTTIVCGSALQNLE